MTEQPQWGAPAPAATPQPQWGAPAQAGGPVPPGTPVPPPVEAPQQPAKKGGSGRMVSIIVGVLVLGAIAVFRFVLPAIEDSKWQVGACLDYFPTDVIEYDVKPNIVDCSDGAAKSKIVGVLGSTAAIEDCEPFGSFASVTRESDQYCIVEV